MILSFKVASVTPRPVKRAQKARRYKMYSAQRLLESLDQPAIMDLLWSTDSNVIAEGLVNELNRVLDIIAPFKTISPRAHYAPHLQASTRLVMEKRDEAKAIHLKDRTDVNFNKYKKLRNKALKLQRSDKKTWAVYLFDEIAGDAKTLWKAVGTVNGATKSNHLSSLNVKGLHLTKTSEIATNLIIFFVDKINKLVSNLPHPTVDVLAQLRSQEPVCPVMFQLEEVSLDKVRYMVKNMKKSRANGSDSLNQMVLSDALPLIEKVLVHLINVSMCSSIFPTIFKHTKIIPIIKAGKERDNPASYRPVSSLCLIGKLIEGAVFDQIMTHVKQHGLIDDDHHGGRSGHSTRGRIVGPVLYCHSMLWQYRKV